jgi:hypothetical protein
MYDAALTIPDLPGVYGEALAECARGVLDRYDVVAILATGTIVRGTSDTRSDLDVYVLHRGNFRQRLQEWHLGVPCEIFLDPPGRITKLFENDTAGRMSPTAHMFASGKAIYDPENVLPGLRRLAQEILPKPPGPLSEHGAIKTKYFAAMMFEDALDLAERDPTSGAMLLGMAVWELMKCRAWIEPGWWPRAKDLPARFRELDPEGARLAALATSLPSLEERLEAARQLCVRVTGAEGFFEWTSEREDEQVEGG